MPKQYPSILLYIPAAPPKSDLLLGPLFLSCYKKSKSYHREKPWCNTSVSTGDPMRKRLIYSSIERTAQSRPTQTPSQSTYLYASVVVSKRVLISAWMSSCDSMRRSRVQQEGVGGGEEQTSRYNLPLRPPFPQHRKQKRQRIRNRHRETQFCSPQKA